jgi:ATP-dependent Clp protease ATP-binding subunit ClpB
MKASVMDVVTQQFRPEFVNRIDDTVVFRPLNKSQIRAIAGIQVERLRERLAEQDIALELTDAALDKLGEAGFDPVYGARPLKRAIQQQLENPLSKRLLAGEFSGREAVSVDVSGDELVFAPGEPAANAAA